jgi:hypothetical protein
VDAGLGGRLHGDDHPDQVLGPGYPAALQTFYRQLAGVIILLPLMARDWRGRSGRPGRAS